MTTESRTYLKLHVAASKMLRFYTELQTQRRLLQTIQAICHRCVLPEKCCVSRIPIYEPVEMGGWPRAACGAVNANHVANLVTRPAARYSGALFGKGCK